MADLRDLLFGDVPLGEWAAEGEPWSRFGDPTAANLHAVLDTQGLESRHYLEAWLGLRALGETAPATLYGVVLDVPVDGGLDTLAAYADQSARYLNHSGAAIVWDRDDAAIAALVDAVLQAGRPLLALAGVWDGSRPPVPTDTARVSLLCADGLHFGQGPSGPFMGSAEGSPVFGAGAALMEALIERAG